MSTQQVATPPAVSWAQTRSTVFVTFNVECEKPEINMDELNISFKGVCAPDRKPHAVDIPLYAYIDPEKSHYANKGRVIEVVLVKADDNAPFWDFLTRDKKKHHWLKVDFSRWVDEGDSENEMDYMNNMMSKMGDFGGEEGIDDNDDVENDGDESSEGEDDEAAAPLQEGAAPFQECTAPLHEGVAPVQEGAVLIQDQPQDEAVKKLLEAKEPVEAQEHCGDAK